MARDTQRQKVYNWERKYHGDTMSLEECRELIAKVTSDYGVGMPTIKNGQGTRKAYGGAYTINLPRWARQQAVVLHEVAHTIHIHFSRNHDEAYHGPEFVRLLIDLLSKYMGLNAAELRRDARAAHLKVATKDAVPRPLTRKAKTLKKELAELRVRQMDIAAEIAAKTAELREERHRK